MRKITVAALTIIIALLQTLDTQADIRPEVAQKRILEIDPISLVLNYEDFDGSFNYSCKATSVSPENPYDYTVRCFDGADLIRTLNIHLIITRYLKPVAPRTWYEILYWVNGEGATSWLYFDEITQMSRYQASQSIAGESAALRVRIKL